MSDKFAISASSGISGAVSIESDRAVSGEMIDGLKSKTLIKNTCGKGILNDGVRVSKESKVLVGESNSGTVISETEFRTVESGNVGASDKTDANKSRVVQTVPRNNNRWESWGVMNMVGRVLYGKLNVDNEVEDIEVFENQGEVNPVTEMDLCQDVVGEPAYENEIDPKSIDINNVNPVTEKDTWQDVIGELAYKNKIDTKSIDIDNVNPATEKDACQEVIGEPAYENKIDTNINNIPVKLDSSWPGEGSETVPNGTMKIEEEFNVKAEEKINDKHDILIPIARGENDITEKEGEYYVSDLMWGKVRSHPWWPGQIFSPVSASDKAAMHLKTDSYLIAYFGDQTFAWNEGSKLKPFRMYFSEMEKQSNSDRFSHAVQCALAEVARRVEFGLSCPCLPQVFYDVIKFQVTENAGVSEESRRRAGGDNLSGAATFLPGDVLQFVESLAESPQSRPDKLQFTIAKAQLMAYNRWKGHYQLPVLEEWGVLLEDDTQLNSNGVMGGVLPGPVSEVGNVVSSRKRKATSRGGSSRKRKHLPGDEESPKIKEKYLSDLMSSGSSPNSERKLVRGSTRNVVSSSENCETDYSMASNSKGRRGRKRKSLLSTSPSRESQKVDTVPAEICTPDTVLSELILAAKKPMKGRNAMISIVGFLHEFRNSICLEKSGAVNMLIDSEKPLDLENADIIEVEGTEDSYWTDRIIQGYSQDHVMYGSQRPKESGAKEKLDVPIVSNMDANEEGKDIESLDAKKSSASVIVNEASDDYCPTTLILNFSNLESIPSVTNLNEIFSRYGPLNETETTILPKGKRAKVVFKRRQDAETAFSSTGKYSIFGPALISYRLHYAMKHWKSRATSKQNKKKNP